MERDLETLEPESSSEPEIEAAWDKEIARRVAEVNAGTVELIPWEKVRAKILAQLDEG
jgi:putative addiction module component (TIGR02574 family)